MDQRYGEGTRGSRLGLDTQHSDKRQDREDRKAPKHAERHGYGFSLSRSGLLTATLLAGVVLLFGLLWRAHQTTHLGESTDSAESGLPATATVGGAEPLMLTRFPNEQSDIPQFSSAMLLPGLGMQILQLNAVLPGGGTYSLLAGPTASEAAAMPAASVDAAPFHLLLWPAGQAEGSPTDVIGTSPAIDVVNRTEADGGEATGTFKVMDKNGRPTGVEAKVDAELTGRAIDLTVRVRNDALSSRQFSLTWSPHFVAPGGDLRQFALSVPSTDLDADGAARSVRGNSTDFSGKDGSTLAATDMDATFINLQRHEIGESPSVRLVNLKNNVVMRVALLSPSVQSVRVRTDATARTLMLSLGTGGTTTLQAGESAEWHVRLDLLRRKPGDMSAKVP